MEQRISNGYYGGFTMIIVKDKLSTQMEELEQETEDLYMGVMN